MTYPTCPSCGTAIATGWRVSGSRSARTGNRAYPVSTRHADGPGITCRSCAQAKADALNARQAAR